MKSFEFDPPVGVSQALKPGLRRILAPNPSPMTYRGTNTYLLGQKALAVIDPGPNNSDHLQAILDAADGVPVEAILVTHSHVDHSQLARPLAKATGAPVLAFGDSYSGRSEIMKRLEISETLGGGEGVDAKFTPDQTLQDMEVIEGKDWQITALWTPGHFGNHMCFAWRDVLFTGDHVMGWASSLVSPPDGDLRDFMTSCRRLQTREDRTYFPGHGAAVTAPAARLDDLIRHREMRTNQILSVLNNSALTIPEIVSCIYSDIPSGLHGAAERNVFAHLIDLIEKSEVVSLDPLSSKAHFALAGHKV